MFGHVARRHLDRGDAWQGPAPSLTPVGRSSGLAEVAGIIK